MWVGDIIKVCCFDGIGDVGFKLIEYGKWVVIE